MHINLALNDDGGPEIFRSIQGEGPMAGRVRTFIRLSGCNLACRWCDTAYTWNWQGTPFAHDSGVKYDPKHEMTKRPVDEAAQIALAQTTEGFVITGGEPMMQRDAVLALAQTLKARAPTLLVEIETNGTVAPSDALIASVGLFVVSPKLGHSGNDAARALNEDSLSAFASLETAHFKFVCQDESDVEAAARLARHFAIAPTRVSIMPEGVTPAALNARTGALMDAIAEHGFSYSDRLHIRLFGQQRGI